VKSQESGKHLADRPPTANELFDQQITRLLDLEFNAPSGLDASAFRARLEPLRRRFSGAYRKADDYPPIIVLARSFVSSEKLVEQIDRNDGKPDTVISASALEKYEAIETLTIPQAEAYVIAGVSTGHDTRNDPPAVALSKFANDSRMPLTIEEGLAFWTQFPHSIGPNDGFSLAGSWRGDRRVPALWVSKRKPKLGWCFLGAPHTWLGTASCTKRIAQ
jgi:hypothetical protein